MSVPAVFLDRDGVLNAVELRDGRPHPPAGPQALRVLPGVPEACEVLANAGLRLIVITNQPDIARGTQTESGVCAINERLRDRIRVDEVVVCPHDDGDGCECRKPLPGMILEAAKRWDVDLPASVTVGDRWRDVEAGRRAGTRTVFIDHHYDEPAPEAPDLIVSDLQESITWILDATRSRN